MKNSGTAFITYEKDGKRYEWRVGCLIGEDNEDTMREHLANWAPESTFIGVRFVADASLVHDAVELP